MTELQIKLLELMKEMDEICRKHDIEYMLFAGTALGAQRHGGFIPWDDDADIIMTLPNYEKLLKVIPGELKPGRAFDALETDSDYLLTYGRYVNTDTTAIQRHTLFGGCHPGIKLDVFCVVPASDDKYEIEKHREDILAFSEVVCTTGRMMTYRPEGFYKRYKEELKKAERLGRKEYVEAHLEELKTRATGSTSGKCILFSGMASNTKLYDADIFDKAVYVPFEDTELPISALNSKFSEQHMGRDWMALPADLSKPRHQFLLDTKTPYEDYIKAAEKKMDLDSCRQVAIDKKENNLYEKDAFRDVLKNNQKIRNAAAKTETIRRLDAIGGNNECDLAAELEAVQEFVKAQLSRSSKVHGLLVDVGTDRLIQILNILIKTGRYYDAENVIKQFEGRLTESSNGDAVSVLKEQAAVLRSIETEVFVNKDMQAAKKLMAEHAGLTDNACVAAAGGYAGLESGENPSEIAQTLSEFADKNGGTGEIYAVLGLCLEKAGDKEESKEHFDESMKTIRNGYLFQELVNRGVSLEGIFERGAGSTGIKISDVMKGRLKTDADTQRAIKETGATSLASKLRYYQYARWVRKIKKPVNTNFSKYEEQLFSLTLD